MKNPSPINYRFNAWVIVFIDAIIGVLLFLQLKNVYPDLKVTFPILTSIINWKGVLDTLVFGLFWVAIFGVSGFYRHIGRKGFGWYSTSKLVACFLGAIGFIFFFLLDNDFIFKTGFYNFFFQLFLFSTLFFWAKGAIYYLWLWYVMRTGAKAIQVILVGDSDKAALVYKEYSQYKNWYRYYFKGYVSTQSDNSGIDVDELSCLGDLKDLVKIVETEKPDEVLVAIDSQDYKKVGFVLGNISHQKFSIKLLPDLNSVLEGYVKTADIVGLPLITISNGLLPVWQWLLKELFDKIIALLGLVVFLPFFPILAIAIKLDSPGPIFYRQTRVGKHRQNFKIIKFRSMVVDAEKGGPALSSINDSRITKVGRYLRKWHIDEISQFVNVLMGDMSIVGPRPERQFFIEQIVKVAPHYNHLFAVKPGITSWGMVKYGYAESLQQMIERLEYDMLYLENMSFVVDLKIILYTIKEVISGRGK